MKIWSVIIAVMLIFGAGVVTGGLVVRTRVVQNAVPDASPTIADAPNPSVAAPIPAPGRQLFVQRVHRELDLTPEQSAKVDQIMAESHRRVAKIYEPVTPQAREESRRVRQEIMALLTPDQRRKFNQSIKRHREMTEERRRGGDSNAFARPQ